LLVFHLSRCRCGIVLDCDEEPARLSAPSTAQLNVPGAMQRLQAAFVRCVVVSITSMLAAPEAIWSRGRFWQIATCATSQCSSAPCCRVIALIACKSWIVPISLLTTLVAALKEHRKAQAENRLCLGLGKNAADLVITDAVGRQIDPDAFSKSFSAEAGAIKKIRFHALRHTHITHLLRAGVPVHVVSARAGHSSPNITLSTYAHLLGGDDERAAEQAEKMLRSALD
jgi:Phage integrase family